MKRLLRILWPFFGRCPSDGGEILSDDIIWVGGGNTLKMMKPWRKLGVDTC